MTFLKLSESFQERYQTQDLWTNLPKHSYCQDRHNALKEPSSNGYGGSTSYYKSDSCTIMFSDRILSYMCTSKYLNTKSVGRLR